MMICVKFDLKLFNKNLIIEKFYENYRKIMRKCLENLSTVALSKSKNLSKYFLLS